MNRIRILHICIALPPAGKGGEEKCILKVLERFQEDYQIDVLLNEGDSKEGNYRLHKFQWKFGIRNNIIFFKKLKSLMKNSNFIHFHFPDVFIPKILLTPYFLWINRYLKKKYIIHIHLIPRIINNFGKLFKIPYEFMNKKLFQKAEYLLSPTKQTKSRLILRYKIPEEKVKSLPYGVSKVYFQINQEKAENNKQKKIIYIGRLFKTKRVDFVIRAFKNLPNEFNLHIYGDGEERKKLENLANKNDRIFFYGYIENEEKLSSAFENANLLVLPSLSEEMPLSIMESLAAGVPVLATSLPTIKSAYKNNIEYIDENDSIDVLSRKIFEISNRDNRNFIENGRKFANEYSWSKNLAKLKEIYNKISEDLDLYQLKGGFA